MERNVEKKMLRKYCFCTCRGMFFGRWTLESFFVSNRQEVLKLISDSYVESLQEYTSGHTDVLLWFFSCRSISKPEPGPTCLQTNLKINGKTLTARREESLVADDWMLTGRKIHYRLRKHRHKKHKETHTAKGWQNRNPTNKTTPVQSRWCNLFAKRNRVSVFICKYSFFTNHSSGWLFFMWCLWLCVILTIKSINVHLFNLNQFQF